MFWNVHVEADDGEQSFLNQKYVPVLWSFAARVKTLISIRSSRQCTYVRAYVQSSFEANFISVVNEERAWLNTIKFHFC
jgi:hypothetical protein